MKTIDFSSKRMEVSRLYRWLAAAIVSTAFALSLTTASAQTVVFSEGFESGASSWIPNSSPVTRVSSATDGVNSSEGAFHAKIEGGNNKGAFTRFGGYRTVFPAMGYTTRLDLYLGTGGGIADDARLDYSSAVAKPDGTHLRDFIFNIGFYTDTASRGYGSGPGFIISTSTGSGQPPFHAPNDPFAVNASGWYTFEHQFTNSGGLLQVTFLIKQGDTVLKSWVRNTTDAIPAQVGGNRYGWLINGTSLGSPDFTEFPSILVDQVMVTSPSPASLPVFNVTKNTLHSTIQGAINIAAAGDILQIAAGNYSESVDLNKAVTLRGAKSGIAAGSHPGDRGTGETILDGGIFASAEGAVIDGMTIRNGRVSGSFKVGVGVSASNITVTNTIIEDVASPAQSDGLSTQAGNNNLTLTNSTIRNNWRGIYLNPGSGHVLSGNLIQGNSGSGVGIGSDGQSSLTLTGNTISNQAEGWGASSVGSGVVASGNSFVSNTVSVAHYSGSSIDANLNYWGSASGPGAGATGSVTALAYYTDASLANLYAPVTNTSNSTYYATIQAAIDAASAGQTIAVAEGTFTEDLSLNKSIQLRGAGPGLTTIVGPIGGAGSTIQVAASNATISGFTITRAGNNVADWNNSGLNSAGIAIQGLSISGAMIHDNLITGMRTAIDINNSGGSTIRNNVITNNHTGLILRNQTDNLLVEENEITGNRTVGILFLDASGGTNSPLQQAVGSVFQNNRITGNWYGQVVDRQTGGVLPVAGSNVKAFANNWLGSLAPATSTANSGEPGYAALIPVIFGGTAEPPVAGSQPDIAGAASANIAFAPLLAESTDTDVETVPGRGTFGFQGVQDNLDAPVKIITDALNPILFQTLEEALAAAVTGDLIELSPGIHGGSGLTVGKAVTLLGANAGLEGTDPARTAESRIVNLKLTITVPGVVIDGVEIHQTNDTAEAVLLQSAATVKNSVIRRSGVNTGTFARGITTAANLTGYVVQDNLFTGDPSGGLFGSHKTWNSGIYLNGGSGTVSGNVFEYCRTAINADDFNGGIVITENLFRTCGTYLAFGGTTPTAGSHTIIGNEFGFNYSLPPASNPTLFNNSNVAPGFRLDVTANTFGGVASTALTDAQKLSLEARNFHRGRSGRNGVVDFVAGQQIVVAGTTIQSAVDAASAGNEIIVGPGTYSGPVSLNKSDLTVRGIASAGVKPEISIAGAVAALGTVVFSPGTSGITLTGFKVIGIDGTAGLEKAAVYLQGNQTGATISGNELVAAGDAALMAEYGASVSGIVIDGNLFSGSTFLLPNTGGPGGGGQFVEPNWPRSLVYFGGASNGANKTGIEFTNNIITAVSGDANNGNTLVNLDGDGVTISGNSLGGGTGSWSATASLLRARGVNTVITENEFTGSSARAVVVGNGTSNSLIENRFLGSYTTSVVNSGLVALDSRFNYWGVANPNFTLGASPNVSFSPWYADAAMTILVTAQNFQTITIPTGVTEAFDDLYIGGGATWTVHGTLRVNGQFVLEPGASLEVVDGDLVFEDGTVMSGSFTFFNSFGSVNFNDDITISGSAEGLILVSDVHVADGTTITVEGPGSFAIDGCTVDSDGTFNLVVESGADFTMARTVFSDGTITIASGDAEIYDNRFDDTNLDVVAPSNGARIFHNIFSPTTDLDDAGTGTVTTVDAWGNVTSESLTENNLPLGLDIAMLPATRTLDAGNAYIQPGDAIGATISVGDLQTKIAGVEVLLGYNTDYFASDDLGLGANWDSGALFTEEDETNVIGRFNAAFAL